MTTRTQPGQTSTLRSSLSSAQKIIQEQFLIPPNLQGAERKAWIRQKFFEGAAAIISTGGSAWLALKITGYPYAWLSFLLSSVILTHHFSERSRAGSSYSKPSLQ